MAVLLNDVTPRVSYTPAPAQVTFTVPFEFFENSDLKVYINGVLCTYDATPSTVWEYSVTGAGVEGGGSITVGSSILTPLDGVTIIRDLPIERLSQFPTTGKFPIETLNLELTKMVAVQQELEEDLGRVLKLGASDVMGDGAYNAFANRIVNLGEPISVTDAATKQYVDDTTNAASLDVAAAAASASAATASAAAALAAAQVIRRRNRVINGSMQINQRGSLSGALGSANTGYGGVDRVFSAMDGTPTVHTVSQEFPSGGGPVQGFYHQTLVTRPDGSYVQKQMRLENIFVRDFQTQGKKMSCSVKVYQDTGAAIDVELSLRTPDAVNDFAAQTYLQSTIVSVPNQTWTEIKLENVSPNAAVINGLSVVVAFICGAVTLKSFMLGDVSVEEGTVCTPFVPESYADDLVGCQRYMFHRGFAGANEVCATGLSMTTTLVGFAINFPTMMRAVPTFSYSGLSASNGGGLEIAITASTEQRMSKQGAQVTVSVAAGLTIGQASLISGQGSSSYLNFWAEL